MSKSPKSVGAKAPDERRSGKDRRANDLVPPKGIERRRTIEPRKPDVVELDLSESEWGKLQLPPGSGSPK
jgi:hypothetical protein